MSHNLYSVEQNLNCRFRYGILTPMDFSPFEKDSRALETDPETFRSWMDPVMDFAKDYLQRRATEPALIPAPEPDCLIRQWNADPLPFLELFEISKKTILTTGINTTSGRFLGYIPTGALPTAAVADFLAALTNRYSANFGACPAAAEVENIITRWFIKIVGFPETGWGVLHSGATLATVNALVAARDSRPTDYWTNAVVYLTPETHHSFLKSLHTVGLGHVEKSLIPLDSQRRMDVEALKARIEKDRARNKNPALLCASAGTTNTGAVDPLTALGRIARKEKLWFHVDAAYGGFFLLTDKGRALLKGIDGADSVVLDPHKGLFLPYGCGAVLVRDGEKLRQSFTYDSAYLQDIASQSPSPADYSPEGTRHFRAYRVWLSLLLHGKKRFEAALEEKLTLARYVHEHFLAVPQIEPGPEPQLSVVSFRVKAEEDGPTARLQKHLQSTGVVYPSATTLEGRLFLRFCFLSFRSHKEHADLGIEAVKSWLQGSGR